jgi:pimeloyl-ACP methyl ester carboxylesterase
LDIYLIIGLTKESRHWSEDFLAELKKSLGPIEIHLVDLPGAGKHLEIKSPRSISGIVDKARSHQIFNPKRKRLVIAISLGGMVAWDWVTRYPDDFHGFVMINSSLAGVSPVFKRLMPKALYGFIQIALAPKGEKKEKAILKLCSNRPDLSEKILPRWSEIGREANMRLSNVINQLLAAMKFKPGQLPVLPMLVVAAQKDRLAYYKCSQDIAHLTSAKFVLCTDPTVGHAFHVDGPEFLAHEIKTWWQDLSL